MQDGWTHVTDKYVTKMMHELLFSDLVSMHDQTCDCMRPTSMHDLKSKHASPTITHGDQTT